MAKGESLEALLTPQLRVSRPVAACSRCRCAKIKCDGKLPACTACERAGKADNCSGANDDYAKGKERSYVAALEAALERLQRRVAEAKALQATDPSRRDAVAAPYMLGPGHDLPARRVASGGRLHRKEASDVDNLVGDFGFLSVNATSRDFHDFTATMSFARLLLAVSKTGDLPQADTYGLPPRYSIVPFIKHYLDDVFVLMPFFSETDLMASVSALYADAGRHAKATDHWMVRMVLAIVAAKTSQDKGDAKWCLAQEHVFAALNYADDVLHPGSIAGIQAILLLVQYSMVDPDLFSCWHLIGFASRVMVDLGLHNQPAAEVRISKDESEMRRRVFRCVYTLDRNISMALDRAFSFTDDSASVNIPAIPHSTVPSDDSRNTGPQLFLRPLQLSLYLFNIRRIQSALYQETRSSGRSEWPSSTALNYTNSIRNDIRSWVTSIPDTLSQSHDTLFRLESLYSEIVALAPSCRNLNITELSRTLIFEYSIQYADQLHPITRDNNWHAFFTLTDIHCVNFIGRQFLGVMWASFDHLLTGAMRRESPASSAEADGPSTQSASPPSPNIFRSTSGLENSTRAIRCLNQTIELLAYAHRRFGNSCASLKTKFEQESAVLMNKLKMKQQELGTVQYITGGPPPRPPVQQQQQLLLLQQPVYEGHPMHSHQQMQQLEQALRQPPRPIGAPPDYPHPIQPPQMRQQPRRPTGAPPNYPGLPQQPQTQQQPLFPIGWQSQYQYPISAPQPTEPSAPPHDWSRLPMYGSDLQSGMHPFPQHPLPFSVPDPRNLNPTHQLGLPPEPQSYLPPSYRHDLPREPWHEEVPSSWGMGPVAPGTYGMSGERESTEPENGVREGDFLAVSESTSTQQRRTYEFRGVEEQGHGEDNAGTGGQGNEEESAGGGSGAG